MKRFFYFSIIAILSIGTIFFLLDEKEVKESITYFPTDPSLKYKIVQTSLKLDKQENEKNYKIIWSVESTLDRKAFLRQDISFLYKNGRLKATLGDWEQNTDKLYQESKILESESGLFQSISVHHSEVHAIEERIFSSQKVSEDELYVIDSSFSPLHSFEIPLNQEDKEWKKVLDQITSQLLEFSWSKGIEFYSIRKEDYTAIPLTEMIQFNDQPLPGFTMRESRRILGNLWEGLYKNYFLGIKKRDGSVIDPTESTIPLILVANDKTHLLVLIETKDGEYIILKQNIPTG